MFEHPGEATFPVSCLVVKRGGMVVFYRRHLGLQHHLRRALCLDAAEAHPGSRFAHLKQASAANQFVMDRRIDPCMSDVFPWDKIPHAHEI